MNELIQEFLNEKRGRISEKRLEDYERVLSDFYDKIEINGSEILEDHVEAYVNMLREENANSTINKKLQLVKSFVRYLLDRKSREFRRMKRSGVTSEAFFELAYWLEEYGAILRIKREKQVPKDRLPFTEEELRLLLKVARNNGSKPLRRRNYFLLKFLMCTGARNTATRLVRTTDLENDSCTMNCEGCNPTVRVLRKGKPGKIPVQIEKHYCLELKQYIMFEGIQGYVFQSKHGEPLTIPQMNKILRDTLQEAGIERKHRTIHSVRRTVASFLVRLGSLLSHVARQLDHVVRESITFREYVVLYAKDLDLHWIVL